MPFRERAQSLNAVLSKAEYGPGRAWPAEHAQNMCLGSLQTQAFREILFFKTLIKKKGDGMVTIVPGSAWSIVLDMEMCFHRHGEHPDFANNVPPHTPHTLLLRQQGGTLEDSGTSQAALLPTLFPPGSQSWPRSSRCAWEKSVFFPAPAETLSYKLGGLE